MASDASQPAASAPRPPGGRPRSVVTIRRLIVVIAILVVALGVSLGLALSSGGSSRSYTDGYTTGVGLGEQATEAPGMVSGTPTKICHDFIRTMPEGDDAGQWLAGCEAAVKEYGPGPTATG